MTDSLRVVSSERDLHIYHEGNIEDYIYCEEIKYKL